MGSVSDPVPATARVVALRLGLGSVVFGAEELALDELGEQTLPGPVGNDGVADVDDLRRWLDVVELEVGISAAHDTTSTEVLLGSLPASLEVRHLVRCDVAHA